MKKMNILVTGSRGFAGKNLCRTLETIRDGKNRTRKIEIGEIFEERLADLFDFEEE